MKRWPQGLWIVTPEGKTLSFHYHQPTGSDNYKQNQNRWVSGTQKMLEEGLKAAGELAPREAKKQNPYPDRGIGLQKNGGARLALSVIGMRNGKQEGPPAIDSFLLNAEEWASFAPQEGKTEWSISEDAAKKFAPCFSPLTDSIFVPRSKDVNKAILAAKVIREADGLQVIRYQGEWQSAHNRDGNAKFPIESNNSGEGIGIYDPAKKQLRSVLLILKGTYRNSGAVTPTASIVEWVAE
jgi:hypothetical protein